MGPLSLDILMNSLLYSLQLSRYSIKFPPVFEFLHADMKDATILSLESPMAFQWLDCFLGFFSSLFSYHQVPSVARSEFSTFKRIKRSCGTAARSYYAEGEKQTGKHALNL